MSLRALGGPVFALLLLGCGRDPRFLLERKPVAEVRHMGWRQDIPDERRGNASFDRAVYTRDGRYLVTANRGYRFWDPETGKLLRWINGTLDQNYPLVVDGVHARFLAKRGDVAPTHPDHFGLWIWDLKDGSRIGMIPETFDDPAVPIAFIGNGSPVVFRDHVIEIWTPDAARILRTIPPPAGKIFCETGRPNSVTYNDKECSELAPTGRWLAVTLFDPNDHSADPTPWVVDLEQGTIAPLHPPDGLLRPRVYGFAFASDERTIAVGVTDGMWVSSFPQTTDTTRRPFLVRGEHQRNQSLTPMSFTAHDTRIVALGDQLQVNTYDAVTGALVGRVAPPFEDWEGSLRVSADGSRAVAYRFVSDILVVIDGATGTQRGYLCPYFCNRLHQPVEVPYAVSPDGRRVASGGRLGAGIWDTDADTLIVALEDPRLPPRRPR